MKNLFLHFYLKHFGGFSRGYLGFSHSKFPSLLEFESVLTIFSLNSDRKSCTFGLVEFKNRHKKERKLRRKSKENLKRIFID